MERVQSKFVIVKQMKKMRFCGGVNIELANLRASKPALLAATRTLQPVSVCRDLKCSPSKSHNQTSSKRRNEEQPVFQLYCVFPPPH